MCWIPGAESLATCGSLWDESPAPKGRLQTPILQFWRLGGSDPGGIQAWRLGGLEAWRLGTVLSVRNSSFAGFVDPSCL